LQVRSQSYIKFKIMKKAFLSLVIASSLAFSAGAQTTNTTTAPADKMNHAKEWHHHKGMEMMKQLNLTQDQKNQLKASRDDYRKQLQELNKNENITVKEFRDKKYALKQQQKATFLSILTPDQKTKLEQLKQQREQQHEAMAAKHLDKMKMQLNLSDDQVAQIKAQRQSMHEKLEAIKDNQNLSRTEKKEQLEALRTENKESFKKILTPDQLNKMDELKKERMQKFQQGNPS
jgi:Spy/CpxP family protein refolding chaperone